MTQKMIDKMRAKQGIAKPTQAAKTASVLRKCGCTETIPVDKIKAEHLKAHLENKAKKLCSACRAAEDEKARASRKPKRHGHPLKDMGRLPDFSCFQVVYNSEKQQWSGTLNVKGVLFTESNSGVFGLLSKLDRMYRESIDDQKGTGDVAKQDLPKAT